MEQTDQPIGLPGGVTMLHFTAGNGCWLRPAPCHVPAHEVALCHVTVPRGVWRRAQRPLPPLRRYEGPGPTAAGGYSPPPVSSAGSHPHACRSRAEGERDIGLELEIYMIRVGARE